VRTLEHLLQCYVRDRRHELDDWGQRVLDRREKRRVRGFATEPNDGEREHRREMQLRWHERLGRGAQSGEERTALVWQIAHELAGEAEHLAALIGREEEHAQVHHRPNVVERELELGDDAEVAPSSAQRPQQIGMLAL
jgi:hypothetical protein